MLWQFLSLTTLTSHILKEVELECDEIAISFCVISVYTSVPMKDSLDFIKCPLISGITLRERCPVTHLQISTGLEYGLSSHYYHFKQTLYGQTDDVTRDS